MRRSILQLMGLIGLVVAGWRMTEPLAARPAEPPGGITTTMLPLIMVPQATRFAVVGDYGVDGQPPAQVGALIASWNPDAVFTTGDNNYPVGAAATIDQHIGQYYHSFIAPYSGQFGPGASSNRFFPSLGNHDWATPGAQPYLEYFTLPNNERYYDVALGPVHWFIVDSDPNEPDGVSSTSIQARWLQTKLAASSACWKLVTMHHPPFSSGVHGPSAWMQWPYAEWGAAAVLAGHDHTYERIIRAEFPYLINGLGGNVPYSFPGIIEGSVVRYNAEHGAMRISATAQSLTFEFITITGELIDRYQLNGTCPAPSARVYRHQRPILAI